MKNEGSKRRKSKNGKQNGFAVCRRCGRRGNASLKTKLIKLDESHHTVLFFAFLYIFASLSLSASVISSRRASTGHFFGVQLLRSTLRDPQDRPLCPEAALSVSMFRFSLPLPFSLLNMTRKIPVDHERTNAAKLLLCIFIFSIQRSCMYSEMRKMDTSWFLVRENWPDWFSSAGSSPAIFPGPDKDLSTAEDSLPARSNRVITLRTRERGRERERAKNKRK